MSVWVALNGRAHRDEQGRFTGYEGVGRDITEQHLASCGWPKASAGTR